MLRDWLELDTLLETLDWLELDALLTDEVLTELLDDISSIYRMDRRSPLLGPGYVTVPV